MNDVDPFAIDKRLARLAFERAAATYDEAAVLQREVGVRMLGRLDYIKYLPRTILDAGSGTGQGSRGLLRRYPKANVLALDIAGAMLQRSKERMPKRWLPFLPRHIAHVCGDIEHAPIRSSSIGMVWCNLTLQWLNHPQHVFAEMYRVLQPDGLLMFSTFGPDTLKELRQAYAGTDRYSHVHRFTDMHDLGDMLVAAGFVNPVMDMEQISMTYSDVTSLMRDLKNIGAHNVTRGRRRGLTAKSQLQAISHNYERFRSDGRLPATFEVVYGHAWKPGTVLTDYGRKVIKLEVKRS
ncbi:MAG TPA: malonyl-ACP O-methyltransferase BioC [Burkholderiales bacterium]|nr:malonyl-ACP O-methyltransferase BioC [Burkholderiales bacterium]